ncbi:hypothetical protein L228DRAFT_126227 [Xylona heveae TC161]|uniref:Uncharacterized protein n=1 Tax=Xylona heveae (strain CBS 132557 / TC161) TaxID=1328760 RepID=A0A165HSY2_XYLHT|nr:hypothetical protein L228DRAFT_126227 [Xylona heveae TC161]KZF23893.1 hypothetical protein L228DRAFT_126227 [Xylona heveae TC161]
MYSHRAPFLHQHERPKFRYAYMRNGEAARFTGQAHRWRRPEDFAPAQLRKIVKHKYHKELATFSRPLKKVRFAKNFKVEHSFENYQLAIGCPAPGAFVDWSACGEEKENAVLVQVYHNLVKVLKRFNPRILLEDHFTQKATYFRYAGVSMFALLMFLEGSLALVEWFVLLLRGTNVVYVLVPDVKGYSVGSN